MITPEGKTKLRQLLITHESYRQFPYIDTTGHITIGIGRNISDKGISVNEALYLLDDDIIYFTIKLNHYCDWFDKLDENRQLALIDMCFNVGIQGFLGFHDMISALEAGDYPRAAKAMLDSQWAQQVHERAITLSDIIKTGII